MRQPSPFLRAGLTVAAIAVVAAAGAALRLARAEGLFSSMTSGFAGTCKALPVAGVGDIEIDAKAHRAYLAVLDARHPGPRDGIYVLDLTGAGGPRRLPGAPKDFHPRSLSLLHTPDGGLLLAAVNHRGESAASGSFSIDTFQVTEKDGAPALAPQGTVMGGLLVDPQDVALVAPNNFYVSNSVTGRNRPLRMLQAGGVLPGGDIVYFNGSAFREVVNGLYGPRGLLPVADGSHVLVSSLTGRMLLSLARETFTGNLSEAGRLDLPAGPDQMALDAAGNAWVAGHAKLPPWRAFGRDPSSRPPSQIFRVQLSGGVPQSAEQVYGNDGKEIAGAETGAVSGQRLLIGSPLDDRLLDCTMG